MTRPSIRLVLVVVAAFVLLFPITVRAPLSSPWSSCPDGNHSVARTTIFKAVFTSPSASGCQVGP